MCGIAGIIRMDHQPVEADGIRKMIDVMSYRGPDDSGVFVERSIGLGHRRLAIIDLSPLGHQPMTNEDGTVWLVFNGEIYNYLELIPLLQEKGHVFRSRSDSEVIIHSYEAWGERCVERFNGMWAFAIWDARRQRLFLSRDRFGVKPLYYHATSRQVCFASEIKSLLQVVPEARTPNYPYLYYFLPSGALDDGEETFFDGVKQVLPAHSIVIEGQRTQVLRHWDYDGDAVRNKYDYANPVEQLRALLWDSIKLRLRSDVPVGTCLSGGLDSSSIVSLASRMVDQPIKTFSCLYEDSDCNERRFVDVLNAYAGTDPYPVSPTGEDLFDVLSKVVWHQDEPTAGPGLYSQWQVMEAAQGKVKVLLDGQGGDELLAGYVSYFQPYVAMLLKELKRTKRPVHLLSLLRAANEIRHVAPSSFVVQQLYARLPWWVRRGTEKAKRVASRFGYGSHPTWVPVIHADLAAQVNGREIRREYPVKFSDDLNNMLYWHLVRQSIPALLHYEDRNSMAHSIEARTPFLDYRLVEFCLGLPYDVKLRDGITKYLLRQALKDDLPKEIAERKDKKGYPTPMARWFRESQQRQMKAILFSPEMRARGIFHMLGIEQKVNLHCEGKIDASWEIYRWLTVELWFRMFIDRPTP